MGRDLQKRKNRSSRPKVRQSNRLKKPLNPLGNSLIAKNWNKKETLSQNYRRLGLTAKLGKAPGGTEAPRHTHPDPYSSSSAAAAATAAAPDPLAITPASAGVRTVRVERDAAGRITRVLRRANPLGDLLLSSSSSDDDDDGGAGGDEGPQQLLEEEQRGGQGPPPPRVVDLLERQARAPTASHRRHQSAREREWLGRLLARHGAGGPAAMARDARLNPMQLTERQIRRKLSIYRQEGGAESGC